MSIRDGCDSSGVTFGNDLPVFVRIEARTAIKARTGQSHVAPRRPGDAVGSARFRRSQEQPGRLRPRVAL